MSSLAPSKALLHPILPHDWARVRRVLQLRRRCRQVRVYRGLRVGALGCKDRQPGWVGLASPVGHLRSRRLEDFRLVVDLVSSPEQPGYLVLTSYDSWRLPSTRLSTTSGRPRISPSTWWLRRPMSEPYRRSTSIIIFEGYVRLPRPSRMEDWGQQAIKHEAKDLE